MLVRAVERWAKLGAQIGGRAREEGNAMIEMLKLACFVLCALNLGIVAIELVRIRKLEIANLSVGAGCFAAGMVL
jgi:hypothetical protein